MKDVKAGWQSRFTHSEPPLHAPNAALMIDFDNVTMGIRSDLQEQLRRLLNSEIIKGKVAVQRAYADWRRYPQYIVPLSEASIDLIFAPAFGSNKKNATDIRLAIDALELVFTRPEIGTFILLSGDSDFSSLVLKLKEYGKYVIGVGLRESSSDLLIQNCDEYFSYTEVTGLAKEGDGATTRRDPWEVVVEAVMQMTRENDVMRSDRLKQVMQTLDPNFSEKDAGFSRFSRFVVEAGQRGLLTLEKMDNGQYAIEVGPNANVPPDEEAALRPASKAAAATPVKPRRKRAPRRREAPSELTLAEAFELLRQALLVLGAVADESSEADTVRTKMMELVGSETDPIFERPRFQRLLRQAHDANLITLAKSDGNYVLKLGPKALADAETATDSKAEEPSPESQASAPPPEKRARSRRSTVRKTSKSRAGSTRPKAEESVAEHKEDKPPAETPSAQSTKQTKRNPRYRRGSRGRTGSSRKDAISEGSERSEVKEAAAPSAPAPKPPSTQGGSSVKGRSGSRGRRAKSAAGKKPDPEPTARTSRDHDTSDRPEAVPAVDPPTPTGRSLQ